MVPLLLGLMAAVATAQTQAPRPTTLLFDGPYRSGTSVSNPAYDPNNFYNQASVEVSYHGWAQIASAQLTKTRTLFSVRSSTSSSTPLPSVWVNTDGFLGMTMQTTAGLETFLGPNVTLDAWFSFGVTIRNGDSRSVTLSSFPKLTTLTFTPQGDLLLTSSTSVAIVDAVTTATWPVPVYVSTLRAMPYIWTSTEFRSMRGDGPNDFVYQNGAELGGFWVIPGAIPAPPAPNITCSGTTQVFTDVVASFYGKPIGVSPHLSAYPTCDMGAGLRDVMVGRCLGMRSCTLPYSSADFGVDPCKGQQKMLSLQMTCATPTKAPSTVRTSASTVRLSSVPSSGRPSTVQSPSTSHSSPPSSSNPMSSVPSSSLSSLPSSAVIFPTAGGSTARPSPVSSVSSMALAPSPIASATKPPAPTSASLKSYRVTDPVTTSTSPTPAGSQSPTISAWLVSLIIVDPVTGLNAATTALMLGEFVADMAAALNTTRSRFTLSDVVAQSELSTLLSFVVLPDSVTDPDGTALVGTFRSEMQKPDSRLRTATLLHSASVPPVPINVVAVRVAICAPDEYAFVTDSGPPCRVTTTTTSSADVEAAPNLTWLLAVGIVAVAIITIIVVVMYVKRSTSAYGDSHSMTTAMRPHISASLEGINFGLDTTENRLEMFVDEVGAAVQPAEQRASAKKWNRTRIERLQHGARDKFGQAAHTLDDSTVQL